MGFGLNSKNRQDFIDEVVRPAVDITLSLDEAIQWISSKLYVEEVFPDSELRQWAEDNGYKKEDA